MGREPAERHSIAEIQLLQCLEELAVEFKKLAKDTPLGFFPAFVQAKIVLKNNGREV